MEDTKLPPRIPLEAEDREEMIRKLAYHAGLPTASLQDYVARDGGEHVTFAAVMQWVAEGMSPHSEGDVEWIGADRFVDERFPVDGVRKGQLLVLRDLGQSVQNLGEFGYGEQATVAAVDPDEQMVRLHLCRYHEELDEWGNCLILTPESACGVPEVEDHRVSVARWVARHSDDISDCRHWHSRPLPTAGRRCLVCCGEIGPGDYPSEDDERYCGEADDITERWDLVDSWVGLMELADDRVSAVDLWERARFMTNHQLRTIIEEAER